MIHEFELVKDNFKEIYNKQNKIKQKITKIESLKGDQMKKVRQSFINEVFSIISKIKE